MNMKKQNLIKYFVGQWLLEETVTNKKKNNKIKEMKVFVRLFFCKPTYLFRRDIVFSASNYKKIWLIPDFCVYVCGGSE